MRLSRFKQEHSVLSQRDVSFAIGLAAGKSGHGEAMPPKAEVSYPAATQQGPIRCLRTLP